MCQNRSYLQVSYSKRISQITWSLTWRFLPTAGESNYCPGSASGGGGICIKEGSASGGSASGGLHWGAGWAAPLRYMGCYGMWSTSGRYAATGMQSCDFTHVCLSRRGSLSRGVCPVGWGSLSHGMSWWGVPGWSEISSRSKCKLQLSSFMYWTFIKVYRFWLRLVTLNSRKILSTLRGSVSISINGQCWSKVTLGNGSGTNVQESVWV